MPKLCCTFPISFEIVVPPGHSWSGQAKSTGTPYTFNDASENALTPIIGGFYFRVPEFPGSNTALSMVYGTQTGNPIYAVVYLDSSGYVWLKGKIQDGVNGQIKLNPSLPVQVNEWYFVSFASIVGYISEG